MDANVYTYITDNHAFICILLLIPIPHRCGSPAKGAGDHARAWPMVPHAPASTPGALGSIGHIMMQEKDGAHADDSICFVCKHL